MKIDFRVYWCGRVWRNCSENRMLKRASGIGIAIAIEYRRRKSRYRFRFRCRYRPDKLMVFMRHRVRRRRVNKCSENVGPGFRLDRTGPERPSTHGHFINHAGRPGRLMPPIFCIWRQDLGTPASRRLRFQNFLSSYQRKSSIFACTIGCNLRVPPRRRRYPRGWICCGKDVRRSEASV